MARFVLLKALHRAAKRIAAEVSCSVRVAAVAEGGIKWLMPTRDKNAINRSRYAQERCRTAILKRARELARSGQYADSKSIIAELKGIEGFENAHAWLNDTALRAQLDQLCEVARVQGARPAQKRGGPRQNDENFRT